ncbi:hypothetical protein BGZ63DRAFT_388023 [Mariannaea sp. PMI_226]|nr:hypothetical protein BGZ63DRAFT_388023 [Mariannaea sp. PMI_226]
MTMLFSLWYLITSSGTRLYQHLSSTNLFGEKEKKPPPQKNLASSFASCIEINSPTRTGDVPEANRAASRAVTPSLQSTK